jgi:hypothetical protein
LALTFVTAIPPSWDAGMCFTEGGISAVGDSRAGRACAGAHTDTLQAVGPLHLYRGGGQPHRPAHHLHTHTARQWVSQPVSQPVCQPVSQSAGQLLHWCTSGRVPMGEVQHSSSGGGALLWQSAVPQGGRGAGTLYVSHPVIQAVSRSAGLSDYLWNCRQPASQRISQPASRSVSQSCHPVSQSVTASAALPSTSCSLTSKNPTVHAASTRV